MESDPLKPELTPEFQKLMEDSGMELVLCGGMHVGMKPPPPRVWRICSKDSKAQIERRTQDLRRMAAASRIIEKMLRVIKDGEGYTRGIIVEAEKYLTRGTGTQ